MKTLTWLTLFACAAVFTVGCGPEVKKPDPKKPVVEKPGDAPTEPGKTPEEDPALKPPEIDPLKEPGNEPTKLPDLSGINFDLDNPDKPAKKPADPDADKPEVKPANPDAPEKKPE